MRLTVLLNSEAYTCTCIVAKAGPCVHVYVHVYIYRQMQNIKKVNGLIS